MTCTDCGSELKKRIYTYNMCDDNDNIYCTNKYCVSNAKNDVNIVGKMYKIKYNCQKCHRTLLYFDEGIFGNYDLAGVWLNLNDCDIEHGCDDCVQYVLSLGNYNECTICGLICKDPCVNHKMVENSVDKFTQITFSKNTNNERCKYCYRHLMKCLKCDNSCYVCVFDECRKSQLNGSKIDKAFSYLCKDHSTTVTNCWTHRYFLSTSEIICEDCGTNKIYCKPRCNCMGANKVSLCINCHESSHAMYKLYCSGCS